MDKSGKLKVLQLLEWFDLGGGLETITGEIALGLDRNQFDVEIWCIARGGKLVEEFRKKGITVRVLDINTYFNPLNILKLALLFRQVKPDIIHTHVYFASTIGRVAARLAGVPICINHVHSMYWHYSKINLLIEKFLSLCTDKIICVSQVVKDFVIRHERIAEIKTVVIKNGITQISGQTPGQRESFGVEKKDILIVCVASLLGNKGHEILLQALVLLRKTIPEIKCLIVGEGLMEGGLKKQATELKLDKHVRFLGVRNDVPSILKACDIFVLPSLYREGLPVSILEAMAYGLPVVASRVGGVPEVITDHVNGLLVSPANAPELAQSLLRLILDPDLRKRLSEQAHNDFTEKFEAKVMIRQIEQLYLQCAKNHGIHT